MVQRGHTLGHRKAEETAVEQASLSGMGGHSLLEKKELEKGERKLSLLVIHCGIFHVVYGGGATSARYNILVRKQFTLASQHKFTWVT